MKIIDLLNKIANGEEVPKVYYCDNELYIGDDGFLKDRYGDNVEWWIDKKWLNKEVEILEEKKIPEKLNNGYTKQSIEDMKEARFNSNDMAKICNRIGWLMENRNELSNKIDEIIDYLKSKGE